MRLRFFLIVFVSIALAPALLRAEELDCLKCHAKLKSEKVVHPALDMGCASCHSEIGSKTPPHKNAGKFAKGLSAEQPDLCYGCHDKALFTKKTVHAAVGMGCTGCHDPHSSKNAKLLVAEVPDLCFNCHDKSAFSKKTVHAPVEGGMCLSCHSPHSSDQVALLLKKPIEVCLECHPDVPKKGHAIAGFSTRGHPLGMPVKKREKNKETGKVTEKMEDSAVKDPARPDRLFYCGSCHNPHSSDSPRLYRYPAKDVMGLCSNCHKM